MPAINFKEQFVPQILSGKKRFTVRKHRKNKIKPDQQLYLYTGMRTKKCRKIGEAIVYAVKEVKIDEEGIYVKRFVSFDNQVLFQKLSGYLLIDFLEQDGFASQYDCINFFKKQYGLPFEGELISWQNFVPQ